MSLLSPRRLALPVSLLLAAGTAPLLSRPASAQMGMPGGALSNAGPLGALNSPGKHGGVVAPKPEIQPDALPGAKSSTPAAPATKLPTDMSPNDALFDAINRGDIAAARDALNRGADLNARNVLGMTPMDLSVDLGRNDISFLLLSLRSQDQDAAAAPPASPTGAQAALTAKPSGRHATAPKPVRVAAPVAKPSVPQAPRLFANDGGSPNPAVGFLGFDPASSR